MNKLTLTKKVTMSTIALSMLAATLGGIPLSQKGFAEKLNLIQTVNAAEVSPLSASLYEQIRKWYAALAAGGPQDVQAVMSLRDELAQFDWMANKEWIDPIWKKVIAQLPANIDPKELKESLFRVVDAVGSIQSIADIEALRSDPEFRATLKLIAAAAGAENLRVDDLLVFIFGDGGSREGLEGKVSNTLGKMSIIQLIQLVGNSKGITEIVLQAMDRQLNQPDDYKVSSVLKKLDISSQDIRTLVMNLQAQLKNDDAALQALSFAYIRSSTQASAEISENGRQHVYRLKLFGVDIPSFVLNWTKVSGSEHVTVLSSGIVRIPEGVPSGSAVIQAKLVSPNGGPAKVIFEKEVTLTDTSVSEENVFPVEEYLKRLEKIRNALIAGGSADVKSVQKLLDEMMGLDLAKNQALIDPIWKPIAKKLPNSVDQAALKRTLLKMIQEVGALPFDVEASQLASIRANPEYRSALKTIGKVAGVPTINIDDILIMMFGDGKGNGGVEAIVRNTLASMSSKELAKVLSSKNTLAIIQSTALAKVLNDTKGYALSKALTNLGVRPTDTASMILGWKDKLKHDEAAIKAMSAAFIRSETESTVKISDRGRQHQYGLTVQGVELPSSSLKWKKVSGSKDVKVDSNGKVTISKKVATETAVIQASLDDFLGGSSKVIFEKEITLINEDAANDPKVLIQNILKTFEGKLADIKKRFDAATTDSEKVQFILEVIQAGNDSFEQINKVEGPKGIKNEAINKVKKQVNQMIDLIIDRLMKF
ncbi:hypothetical protein [Paenibacillus terrigena]|uniref:hypothetical protein n=1 Tax=Paenibacillus terrigena TaxID=369333 RepID=UPI00035E0608|nr:hypothetical protein [Paenibacillus terrigena]